MAALGTIGSKMHGASHVTASGARGLNVYRPPYTDGNNEQTLALYDHTVGLTDSGIVDSGLGIPGQGGGITIQ